MIAKKWLLLLLVPVFALGLSSAVLGGEPGDIEINHVEGDKGAVKFSHTKHTTDYKKDDGSAIVCKDCHHTLDTPTADAASVKSCSSCHDGKGEAPPMAVVEGGKVDKKSVIFHTACVDCHKAQKSKKIGGCKTCH